MGPKKGVKMDLGSFLADDKFGGSWADDEIDFASISVPQKTSHRSDEGSGPEPFRRSGGDSSSRHEYQDREVRERKEFPIPDAAPWRAKVSNCPWDITEQSLVTFFVRGLLCKSEDIVEVSIPKDIANERPKGFAFVEFNSRALLEDSLNLSGTSLNDRRVFVNVAAPPREDMSNMDWRAVRSGPLPPREFGGDRESREPREPRAEVDWSNTRSGPLPPREYKERSEVDWSSGRGGSGPLPPREPREPRVEVDWSNTRSGPLPPRESRSPRESREPREPRAEVDWSNIRSGPLPPREQREQREYKERKPRPEVDWSNIRSGQQLPPREQRERKPRTQPDNFDWSSARTGPLPPRERKERKTSATQSPVEATKPESAEVKKTKISNFDVLAVEGDDDQDDETTDKTEKSNEVEQTELEKATANLSVKEGEADDWEVQRK